MCSPTYRQVCKGQRYYNHLRYRHNTYNAPKSIRKIGSPKEREKNKPTISFGKYSIGISERQIGTPLSTFLFKIYNK